MARRDEYECAWCAKEILNNEGVIGKDWKVYCSAACVESGDELMDEEDRRRCLAQQPTLEHQARL